MAHQHQLPTASQALNDTGDNNDGKDDPTTQQQLRTSTSSGSTTSQSVNNDSGTNNDKPAIIRGIRAVASESWDDDFLWQQSSSSDLHLPSSSTRHQQHHQHRHQSRHNVTRDKRISTASSSSEYYAHKGLPLPSASTSSSSRPTYSRTHRKASTLSTTSTLDSIGGGSHEATSSNGLNSSTSSNGPVGNYPHHHQYSAHHWASLSRTSFQEDEEDDPTITLATLAARHQSNEHPNQSLSVPPRHHPSPSKASRSPAHPDLPSPSPSPSLSASASSWRSPTPSLALSDNGIITNESASSATETETETDNETIEETWEDLINSETGLHIPNAVPGSNSKRRRRGRGDTLSLATPRMLNLSTLFGGVGSGSNKITSGTVAGNNSQTSKAQEGTATPSKGFGASFFRRSSRRNNKGTPATSSSSPATPTQDAHAPSKSFSQVAVAAPSELSKKLELTKAAQLTQQNNSIDASTNRIFLRAPAFIRNASSSSAATDLSALSSSFGTSPPSSLALTDSQKSEMVSNIRNPAAGPSTVSLYSSQHNEETLRVRQSTGASSGSPPPMPPPFFPSSPDRQWSAAISVQQQKTYVQMERTPRGSNTTNSSSEQSHLSNSTAESRISYTSALSDRLRFSGHERIPVSSRSDAFISVDGHTDGSSQASNLQDSFLSQHVSTESDPVHGHEEGRVASHASHQYYHGRHNLHSGHYRNSAQHSSGLQSIVLPDTSTTSLISIQSSATYMSGVSGDEIETGKRSDTVSRKKLKKKTRPGASSSGRTSRPDTPATQHFASLPVMPLESEHHSTSPVYSPSLVTSMASQTLAPAFAFPNRPTLYSPTPSSRSSPVHPGSHSSADSNAANALGGSQTSSTSSANKEGSKVHKKLGIGNSLRRRMSKRSKQAETFGDNSADEAEAILDGSQKVGQSLSFNLRAASGLPSTMSSSTITPHTHHWHEAMNNTSHSSFVNTSWTDTTVFGNRERSESVSSNKSFQGNAPTHNSEGGLLATLSRRISRELRISRVPFPPSPEKKRSMIFVHETIEETPSQLKDESETVHTDSDHTTGRSEFLLQNPPFLKKHKRPLSLSGILSRSNNPFESRSRTSTSSSGQTPLATPSAFVFGDHAAPSNSAGPASAGVLGTFRRPAGFLHRSTASSGNVPTARALQNASDKRQSLEMTRSPPALQSRRSFNPLWRGAVTASVVMEERPPSSLSLLSDTATVRPLSMSQAKTLPVAIAQTENTSKLANTTSPINTAIQPPPTRLRQRHLPSLSLTLTTGRPAVRSPKSAGLVFPSPSPRALQRAHSEDPHGPATNVFGTGYFGNSVPSSSSNGSSSKTSFIGTPSAGHRSYHSDGSDDSMNVVRRVSLSDLKIPQRITNAQAKIGQDLKRVKQFKDGVEELKRLRRVYRSLLSSDRTPDTTCTSDDVSHFSSSTSTQDRGEWSPSPPPLSPDAAAKMDNLMARVAFDYRQWWEIADVLIKLADGAEDDDDSLALTSPRRERCHSEMTYSSNSPPKTSFGGELQDLDPQPSESTPIKQKLQRTSNNEIDKLEQTSSATSHIKTPPSPRLLSPVSAATPVLTRSYSTSSFTPTASIRRKTRTSNLHESTLSSMSTLDSPDTPSSPGGQSRERTRSNQEGNTTSLSERQLEILRGMLLKPSMHIPLTPSMSITSAGGGSTPNSPVPSFSATSTRSNPSLSGSVNRKNFDGGVKASFTPISPLNSREKMQGVSSQSSTLTNSTSISSLRAKSNGKSGYIALSKIPTSDSTGFADNENAQNVADTASSLADIMSPFHVSTMVPLLPSQPQSPPEEKQSQILNASPKSRQSPLSSNNNKSLLKGKNREGTDTAANMSSQSTSSSTPTNVRRGRLRQASRAGMLGIRDFLKTLNSSAPSSSSSTSGASNSAPYSSELSKGGPGTDLSRNGDIPERSIIGSNSFRPSPLSSLGDIGESGMKVTRERSNTIVTVVEISEGMMASPPSQNSLNAEKVQIAAGNNSVAKSRSGSGSSDEEDWDRRSSDDENDRPDTGHRVTTYQGGDRGGQSLPRSDTQATVMPGRLEGAILADTSSATQTRGLTAVTAASIPSSVSTRNKHHLLMPGTPASSSSSPLLRGRTYSANSIAATSTATSTTSTTTIDLAMKFSHENGISSPAGTGTCKSTITGMATSSSSTPAANSSGSRIPLRLEINLESKLVMTSEAMPTLLEKIKEVKQHCATCVTELRNVTV